MRDGSGSVAIGSALAGVLLCAVALASEPPVVPGYSRLRDEGKAPPAELGQVLLGELNCTQCHAAQQAKRILTRGAPDLGDAGSRLTPQYIQAYLSNPHGMKPGTVMPDLFHASEAHAKQGAVEFLTHYLISLGGPIRPATLGGDVVLSEQGRKLYHSVGCVACHAPENNPSTKVPSYPLPDLARKTTVDQLETFLLDPIKVRPGSRMPNAGLSRDEAHAVAVYLLREQMNNPQSARSGPAMSPGIQFEYYEQRVGNCSIEDIGKLTPRSKGRVKSFGLDLSPRRNEDFALKFAAVLRVPKAGKYTIYATSDDGSRVYIDSKLVVDNDGEHAATEKQGEVELSEGDHPIIVTYFQGGGESELKVEWEGPGIPRQAIPESALFTTSGRPMIPLESEPFQVDPQKAQMGERMFAALGCASCHAISGVKSLREAKPLASLNAENDGGCLGTHVDKGLPNYDLSEDQRKALKAAIADQAGLDEPFSPKDQILHTMAAMNCFACHARDNVGGPTADRQDFFVMTSEFDMGTEGKLPPALSHVGMKLLPGAMEQIIFEGKLHVRPVMATRMPMFARQAVGDIVDAFQKADTPASGPNPPRFSEQLVKDGRTLVGTKGLGCVNCHGLNGVKSLGMPAPDLGTVHDRIKFGWFHQWLDNPPSLVLGTRMPQFWPGHEAPLKNIADGTEEGQINAIWSYLSLGKSMALPAGLIPTAGYELIPADVPIVHRTFMAGIGPRAILVGFPEMVHVAFDANGVRVAKAWRGRFFDAKGMWEGRGGNWLGPLGTDVIDMPPGPAFAILEHASAPWPRIPEPVVDEKYRNIGGHFKGYTLDKEERPTFHYVLDQVVDIHEQPLPVLTPSRAELKRNFELSAKGAVKGLYFMAAAGHKIESTLPGVWVVDDGKLTVTLSPADKLKPLVRDSDGHKQLLIPISFTNGAVSFDEEMSW